MGNKIPSYFILYDQENDRIILTSIEKYKLMNDLESLDDIYEVHRDDDFEDTKRLAIEAAKIRNLTYVEIL